MGSRWGPIGSDVVRLGPIKNEIKCISAGMCISISCVLFCILYVTNLASWLQDFDKPTCLITYLLTTDIHLVSEYGRRPLRSSTDRTLTVPRTHNRFGDRSFAVAGTRLWNSLLISLRQISSYGQFRRYLKNHLFGI